MSDPNQELKDLILALDKKLDGFDRKFETQITELKNEVRLVRIELEAKIDLSRSELEAKIDLSRSELEAKIDLSRSELEVKIAELSGKMDGYSKRLDQQEFVSRGAILALVVGVASGFIKYLFFTS
ncbi:hypothetical protein [Thermostichus vulcanus]|uniref:Uncharacterized protein n=1 Tax=Thermostichus vulcanus str. 'Rupite' TaxID=2813851 RepID=A0ABT0CD25_THEVL|nr:hypothetical protein [Thermostichus vulcanus]MCJ2543612.1 hypothetical protein [Thermostichus vulcanus str. 'Rupite']